jgi:RNA polymerase subunit RPABC4/transcription elongation factor Spt4
MQFEAIHDSGSEPRANAVTKCLNCHAAMPSEMRFCRACGQRLGEGLAEYVETVRFDQSPRAAAAASELSPQREAASAHGVKNFGARVADDVAHGTFKGVEELFKNLENAFKQNQVKLSAQTNRLPSFGGGNAFRFNRKKNGTGVRTKKRGAHWLTWMSFWIVIGLLFTVFINLTSSDSRRRNRDSRATATRARESAAAVRQRVAELREAALKMREEIIADAKGARSVAVSSGGEGSLGLDDSDSAFVAVPGTIVYGVQLGEIERNSPADLSGLREKDIVIEFDGAPLSSMGDFNARIKSATPGKTLKAVVMRGAERREIPVVMGQDD